MEINEFLHLIAIFAVLLRGSTDPISRLVMVRLASGERMETRDESPHPIFRANLLHGR